MAVKTYSEKLKDPRWQKKRLQILERDDFACQECKSKSKTLHVHHKTYVFGRDPWNYPDTNLITLCKDCHESEEYHKTALQDVIHDLLIEGYTYEQLSKLLTAFMYPLELEKKDRIEYTVFCAGDIDSLNDAKNKIQENFNAVFDKP